MKLICPALALLCATSAIAQPGIAQFRAYSRSLALNPTTAVNRAAGNPSFQLHFSTSHPGHLPLFVPHVNGDITVSSELRRVPGTATHTADFGLWSGGYIAHDGRITLRLPVRDADFNRIPDLIERDKTFYHGILGKAFILWPATNTLILEGVFSRAAGSSLGAYTGIMRGTGANYHFTGSLGLLSLEGEVAYSRGTPNTLDFFLVRTGQLGQQSFLTGTSTYRATRNAVQISRTILTSNTGETYIIKPSTLLRKNDRYVGALTFVDGSPETPWPDFLNWVVEITDLNDSDDNRIPDFSDPSALWMVQTTQ
jgi:hypothetical protein